MPIVLLTEVKKGDVQVALARGVKRPDEALLKQIGAFVVARAQKAFTEQKRGPFAWVARKVPNIAAIISDFTRGTTPPARRFQGRPALIDTGHLKKSITFQVMPPNAVAIGTMLPYAGIHQYGGETETLPVTPLVQQRLWAWMKSLGAQKPGTYAEKEAGRAARRSDAAHRRAVRENPTVKAAEAALKNATTPYAKAEARRWLKRVKEEATFLTPKPHLAPRSNEQAQLKHDGAQSLRWLLNRKFTGATFHLKIPPRPFLMVTESERKEIERLVGRSISVTAA